MIIFKEARPQEEYQITAEFTSEDGDVRSGPHITIALFKKATNHRLMVEVSVNEAKILVEALKKAIQTSK
jgi:hypothetical protein